MLPSKSTEAADTPEDVPATLLFFHLPLIASLSRNSIFLLLVTASLWNLTAVGVGDDKIVGRTAGQTGIDN